jgi:hypothetical protein
MPFEEETFIKGLAAEVDEALQACSDALVSGCKALRLADKLSWARNRSMSAVGNAAGSSPDLGIMS